MKIRTAPSMVSCADCGYAIRFQPTADWKAGIAIGACSGPSCQNYRKPFKFQLPLIEVEFIEGDESHGGLTWI